MATTMEYALLRLPVAVERAGQQLIKNQHKGAENAEYRRENAMDFVLTAFSKVARI